MTKTIQQTPPWFKYPKYHWIKKQAVIIGGGIAGSQIARHLCESGWQVTLIERHTKLATEASGNPVGAILPKMTSQQSIGEDFYTECFNYTLSQLDHLSKEKKEKNQKIEWDQCGALQLSHNSREQKRWDALNKREFSKQFLQLLNEDQTSQQAGIKLPYKSIYFPQAGWIKPDSFCDALVDHPNCEILLETEALSLIKKKEQWHVLKTQKNEKNQITIAKAEAILMCSGKDLSNFEQTKFLPNQPVAGQTTFAQSKNNSSKLKTVIGHEGYLTPVVDGQHTFGATFDRDIKKPKLNKDADSRNRNQLEKYLPDFIDELTNFTSAHTAVRVTTPDRFPYCGELPDKDFYQKNYHDLHQGKQYKNYPNAEYQTGLFVFGGLGSRGLTTSGLCAKNLCDLLENKLQSNENDNQDEKRMINCHPARFLIKALKRNI